MQKGALLCFAINPSGGQSPPTGCSQSAGAAARLASGDSKAMKNKPIVEYLEHMACPPTASREKTKRRDDEFLFRSLIGHNVLVVLCKCVCV